MLHPSSAAAIAALVAVLCGLTPHVVASGGDEEPLVQLGVYMETLCPASAFFVKEQLPLLFINNMSSILELSIVPWGNAIMTPDGPQCQHGPVECQMNRKMSCFNYYHSDQAVLLQYAACSEGHSALDIDKAATKCISDLGLDVAEIQECEDGPLGDELQSQAMNDTAALQPAHLWVPWVVVNGQPIFDDFDHVQQYVCAAYTGTRPAACSVDPTAPPGTATQLMKDETATQQYLRSFMSSNPTRPAHARKQLEPCPGVDADTLQ